MSGYLPADVLVAERIVRQFPSGVDLTMDNWRAEFQMAQIAPNAYGPLCGALVRTGVLVSTNRCTRSRNPASKGSMLRVYQLAPSGSQHGSARRP